MILYINFEFKKKTNKYFETGKKAICIYSARIEMNWDEKQKKIVQ